MFGRSEKHIWRLLQYIRTVASLQKTFLWWKPQGFGLHDWISIQMIWIKKSGTCYTILQYLVIVKPCVQACGLLHYLLGSHVRTWFHWNLLEAFWAPGLHYPTLKKSPQLCWFRPQPTCIHFQPIKYVSLGSCIAGPLLRLPRLLLFRGWESHALLD